MNIKLYDSEIKVMEVLWEMGEGNALDIVNILIDRVGWSKSTAYTVLKKCVDKGAIERRYPGFYCIPLVSRNEVQQLETTQLIDKLFSGSSQLFFSAFLKSRGVSEKDAKKLSKMIEEHK